MFALSLYDEIGEDSRRTARQCAAINTTVMNALRLSGKEVHDSQYREEEDYMPGISKRKVKKRIRRQSWAEIRANLGFG